MQILFLTLSEISAHLLEELKGASFEKVLGPPTSMCYKCSCDLVQYHQCHVRCFSTSGFEHAMKITLRCLHCGLFYNYAQFGNKREVGFRFYQEPREYIEANDAVFFIANCFSFSAV